jgi:hypothetical protein
MIELVISGGQTGADQAGWRAAKACGIATGGWMPKGFRTEDGFRPGFADLYGAREHESKEYPVRTAANVCDSDAILWFGSTKSPGFFCTHRAASSSRHARPMYVIRVPDGFHPPVSQVTTWLDLHGNIRRLNVAGNRESSSPGIGSWVERYLAELFRAIQQREGGG